MTGAQKQTILEMRLQGAAYTQIAGTLGLSMNTVKSFCRRNLPGACDASDDTENEELDGNKDRCKQCGKQLKQSPKGKTRTFCCDACRYAWWSMNRRQPNRKGSLRLTCAHCGREFISYGNPDRKYCGHACYIACRFGQHLPDGEVNAS